MDINTLLILWAVSAVGCYLIASSRHDPSPVTWAIVGVLLGPIGVLLALLVAKPKRA